MDLTNYCFYLFSSLYGGRKMLKFEEGQTYICTGAANEHLWWTVGKRYPVTIDEVMVLFAIQDDDGEFWYDYELNRIFSVRFKLEEENKND